MRVQRYLGVEFWVQALVCLRVCGLHCSRSFSVAGIVTVLVLLVIGVAWRQSWTTIKTCFGSKEKGV